MRRFLKQAGVEIPFVGPDNRAGARRVGEYLAQRLKPGDQVAILEGIRTAFNAQQRRLGFEDAMQAAGHRDRRFAERPVGDGTGEPDRFGDAQRA